MLTNSIQLDLKKAQEVMKTNGGIRQKDGEEDESVYYEGSTVALINSSSEQRLIDKLLNGYDISIRPVMEESDIVYVNVSINQLSLLIVDQAQETIQFSGEFILSWRDSFLTWTPEQEGDLKWLKIKQNSIWKPDTTVSSSTQITTFLSSDQVYADVSYTGTVRSSLFGVITNLCSMKVNEFPYDTQHCKIDVGPWSYTSDQVYFSAIPSPPDVDLDGNSEWNIINITSTRFDQYDGDVGFNYTNVRFHLTLKRKPLFYVWVLLVPTYIITFVCIFGLFTPTNSLGDREEKVNLGMSTLLSSTVILQIIANSMPKTSTLPLLGNFILAEIFVVAIGVILSVVILVLHHRANTREWTPPRFVARFLSWTGSRKFVRKYYKRIFIERKESKANEKEKKVAFTGTNGALFAEIETTVRQIKDFLDDEEEDRVRELAWIKFFDRIDCFCLIFFQVGNAILTGVITRH